MTSILNVLTETRVNTVTTNDQYNSSVSVLSDGTYVVTWTSSSQDGSNAGIYMQRYSAAGAKIGLETKVNTTVLSDQQFSSVTGLLGGGYVVTWTSTLQDTPTSTGMYMQRYNASGVAVGTETLVNTFTTGNQGLGEVTLLGTGGYVVTWLSDGQDGAGLGVYMQIYSATGAAVGAETRVNTTVAGDQTHVSVTGLLDDGAFVVTWDSFGQDGSFQGIYTQRFDALGTKVGAETLVNTTVFGAQGDPDIGLLGDGGYIIAWTSADFSGSDVYMQRYDADGDKVGGETRINTTVASDQLNVTVTGLSDGGFLVTWDSKNQDAAGTFGVYAQRYDAFGIALGGEMLINSFTADQQGLSSVTALDHGGFVVTWTSGSQDGSGLGVYQKVFSNAPVTSGSQLLYGTAVGDALNGGTGADTMFGGSGNDSYWVDNAGDVVGETATGGTDTVNAAINYTLGDNFERLTLIGTANTATGNAADNILTGNARANILNGLAGADAMTGGAGNDTYYVDSVGDSVVEVASEGRDRVISSITYVLGANVEDVTLTGTNNLNATGNGLINVLNGNAGNNVLDGGASNDVMYGAAGNDTFYVDNGSDKVFEAANEGTDLVISTVSFAMGNQYIEQLILEGAATNGIGNGLANTITGNALNNTLTGGAGADTLYGRSGNDIYVVDNLGDVASEQFVAGTDDGGNDSVQSSITYTLGAFIENLTLTGTANIRGFGNALDNTLVGNSGNNILSGLAGGDKMYGNAGDDIYIVDNIGDRALETNKDLSDAGGTDLVQSSITFVLGAFVENLTLTGAAAINGYGNGLGNTLIGNAAINTLNGLAGNDLLTGGAGADIFLFLAGSGADIIGDFSAAQNDSINLHSYAAGVVNGGGITVTQVGGNTLIDMGGGNTVTVTGALVADVNAHIVW